MTLDNTCHYPHRFKDNEPATKKKKKKKKKGMGSQTWQVSMVDTHLRNLLWVYCPGHAGLKENDQAASLAGKASCHHKWLAPPKV